MKRTTEVITCDHCGQLIFGDYTKVITEDIYKGPCDTPDVRHVGDICPECWLEFMKWLDPNYIDFPNK